jgi:hypothetical protein
MSVIHGHAWVHGKIRVQKMVAGQAVGEEVAAAFEDVFDGVE